MSSLGPSEGHGEDARGFQNQQMVVLDLDLNSPLCEESLDAAAQGLVLVSENLQLQIPGDAELDDVVIISPRKFEEAKNNSRRKTARRNYGVIQVLDEDGRNNSELLADGVSYPVSDSRHETAQNLAIVDCELRLLVGDSTKAEKTVVGPKMLSSSEVLPEEPTFSCTICMGQLIEATSTKCGHIFCKKCIQAAIAAQHKCPTCRRKLRKSDMFRVYLPTAN